MRWENGRKGDIFSLIKKKKKTIKKKVVNVNFLIKYYTSAYLKVYTYIITSEDQRCKIIIIIQKNNFGLSLDLIILNLFRPISDKINSDLRLLFRLFVSLVAADLLEFT